MSQYAPSTVEHVRLVIEIVFLLSKLLLFKLVRMLMIFATRGSIEQVKKMFNIVYLHIVHQISIGGVVGVERGCVSPDIEKFRVIQDLIGYLDHGCIKRQNGLACFRFCSIDECN